MVLSWPQPCWIVLLQISYLVKPKPFFIQVTTSGQEHSATRIIPFCISALSPPCCIRIPLFSAHEWAAQILRGSYSANVGAHNQDQLPCVVYHTDTTACFELLFVPVQVRGQTGRQGITGLDMSVGTRVGRDSLVRPEAPLGANDKEYMVSPQHEGIRKRSIRKAISIASRTGLSLYRGKILAANVAFKPSPPRTEEASSGHRMHIFSWNCSGLSQELLAELLLWLDCNPQISVIFLQETHWGQSMEWSKKDWHFIHSASGQPNSAGLLVGVRDSLARVDGISWAEPLPGRLLHVRCFAGDQHVDLVNCYQHALAFGDSQKLDKLYGKRRGFWQALSKLVSAIPFRSQLVLGGDFNCSLEAESKVVGHGVLPGSQVESARQDRSLFMDILVRGKLCALNTWSRKFATYEHPKGRSQIDFVMVRQHSADRVAKQTKPEKTILAGWRTSGHLPLQANLILSWKPWKRSRKSSALPAQRVPKLLGFLGEQGIHGLYDDLRLQEQHSIRPRMPQLESSNRQVLSLWELKKRLRLCSPCTLGGFFRAFGQVVVYCRAQRELRKSIRRNKRRQLLDTLQLAEEAAKSTSASSLFGYVRLLCPKTMRQRVRLRDDAGSLVDRKTECKILAEYASRLFHGNARQPDLPELLPVSEEIFSAQAWSDAISKIPSSKAVPSFSPQTSALKANLNTVCCRLEHISRLCLSCQAADIPAEWLSVQIAWLPKPAKSPSRPEHLRTIGLMPADQKALLHIIKNHIKPEVLDRLAAYPQYAYRSRSSTHDAILRASSHCAVVRSSLEACSNDLTSKLLGADKTELVGGLMASLDLAKAFDSLPHREIYLSL